MSKENVETVRRIWSLWAEGARRGDASALQAPFDEGLLSPDIIIIPVQDIPDARPTPYVGVEGLREFVGAWTEDWAEWRIGLEDVVDAGDDRVVAVIHQSAVGRASGVSVDLRFATAFTFEDGQVVERRDYATLDEALQAGRLPG